MEKAKNSLPVQKIVFVGIAIFLAILSLIAPIWPSGPIEPRVGGLLIFTALLELLH